MMSRARALATLGYGFDPITLAKLGHQAEATQYLSSLSRGIISRATRYAHRSFTPCLGIDALTPDLRVASHTPHTRLSSVTPRRSFWSRTHAD